MQTNLTTIENCQYEQQLNNAIQQNYSCEFNLLLAIQSSHVINHNICMKGSANKTNGSLRKHFELPSPSPLLNQIIQSNKITNNSQYAKNHHLQQFYLQQSLKSEALVIRYHLSLDWCELMQNCHPHYHPKKQHKTSQHVIPITYDKLVLQQQLIADKMNNA